MISVSIGFVQAFVYAEIAGLFPNKSGGASVYGAAAWVRYSKFIAPLSVWCNWLAWTPTLAVGCGIAAGYVLNELFPAQASIRTWELQLADLGFIKSGMTLRLDATFFIGFVLMLVCYGIQHRGILGTARVAAIFAVASSCRCSLVGIVPWFTGDVVARISNPFAPGHRAGDRGPGTWPGGACSWAACSSPPVGLRLRDRDLLHQAIHRPETGHVPRHPLGRPVVHCRLHPSAADLPGLAGPGAPAGARYYDGAGVADAMASMIGTAAASSTRCSSS